MIRSKVVLDTVWRQCNVCARFSKSSIVNYDLDMQDALLLQEKFSSYSRTRKTGQVQLEEHVRDRWILRGQLRDRLLNLRLGATREDKDSGTLPCECFCCAEPKAQQVDSRNNNNSILDLLPETGPQWRLLWCLHQT